MTKRLLLVPIYAVTLFFSASAVQALSKQTSQAELFEPVVSVGSSETVKENALTQDDCPVTFHNQKLSVDFVSTPLVVALLCLEKATGIIFENPAASGGSLSLFFENQTLEQGLAAILKGKNTIYYYQHSPPQFLSRSEKGETKKIKKITLLTASAGAMPEHRPKTLGEGMDVSNGSKTGLTHREDSKIVRYLQKEFQAPVEPSRLYPTFPRPLQEMVDTAAEAKLKKSNQLEPHAQGARFESQLLTLQKLQSISSEDDSIIPESQTNNDLQAFDQLVPNQ